MDEGFLSIQSILELIRQDLIGISGHVVWIGQSIGAIGAMLYLAMIAYEGMLGGRILSMRMLRPFAIALLLALYPQFMLVVDSISMAVNTSLGQAMITEDYRITDILKTRDLNPETDDDDALLGIEDINAEEGEEEASLVDQITDGLSESLNVIKWVGDKFYWAMMRFMEEILFRLSHAALLIVNTLRVFFLVVLYIFGPLVIGLSTFPGFESAFGSWMGKYLNVHLWLGIGNIFEAIAVRLWKIIVDNGGFWTEAIGIDTANAILLTSWAWIYLVAIIMGYITIPLISSWIISAGSIGRSGAGTLRTVVKMTGKK